MQSQFILDIPDDYSSNYFGPFQDIKEATAFLIKHYPKPIEKLVERESSANPRNLLTIYYTNRIKNIFYKSFGKEYIDRGIATLHEVNTEPCTMIIRDGH